MAGSCDDRIQRTMILALAIRHRMERPAISMEGGTMPMEQFAAAVCLTYEKNNKVFQTIVAYRQSDGFEHIK